METKSINLLIAEDIELMRGRLVALLSHEVDITVVAELDSGDKIVSMSLELKPDVALIDIHLRGGFAAARKLHQQLPECGTLIMADRRRPRDLRRAMNAHFLGFVLKDATPDLLADAIRSVARGERVVDSELAFAALHAAQSPLTPRELEVLEAAAEGISPTEIAAQLYLSVRTVRNHLSQIIRKTGARNRVDAIRIALEAGWL
jgi:two-component system, NarL family, response regulator DesR